MTTLPEWALTVAGPNDQPRARDAHQHGRLSVQWPDRAAVRAWAKQHHGPTPWFGFEQAFLTWLLESRENFVLAITDSGVQLRIPRPEYQLSLEWVSELDALYAARSASGRPSAWGVLVEELRDIRRAIEAGVVVSVEQGPTLRSFAEFYTWAHGRYHMLEDGYDRWIGDDAS